MVHSLIACVLLSTGADSSAQISSISEEPVDAVRLGIVGAATAGTMIGLDIYQRNAWWSGQRGPFHVVYDWEYALWVDKIGHVFGGVVISDVFASSLRWARVPNEQSVLYGAALGTVFGLYVEYQDGFARDWGFSPGDAIGTTLGAWYPFAQHHVPWLRNFNFKWSYLPSRDLKNGKKKIFIDDYEGQTMWLSVSVKSVFGEVLGDWYPGFLNLAIGYGVRELDGSGGGKQDVYLALDYDIERLPGEGAFLIALKKALNYFHFPAPTMRINSSGLTFFGLYFSRSL